MQQISEKDRQKEALIRIAVLRVLVLAGSGFFLVAFQAAPAHAALENVTALIQELPGIVDAIADLVPSIVRMLIYFAVAGLVLGIFGAIVYKIKKAGMSG